MAIGPEPIARLGPQVLESLYADLRRCRDHCRGRRYVQHRTDRDHRCDEHGSAGPCTPYDDGCRACRRMCKPHQCRPFADSGIPDTATQRYDRLAERLGINTTLHKLGAYAATELLNGGVDVRAVAGRLGHGSGGAMTLRAYAAWLAEADQRAAPILAGRMPDLPAAMDVSPTASGRDSTADQDEAPPAGPYQRIARDLEGAVAAGLLTSGDRLPTIKDLAARYGVAVATVHRAIAKLQTMGLVDVSRGRRAVVR